MTLYPGSYLVPGGLLLSTALFNLNTFWSPEAPSALISTKRLSLLMVLSFPFPWLNVNCQPAIGETINGAILMMSLLGVSGAETALGNNQAFLKRRHAEIQS